MRKISLAASSSEEAVSALALMLEKYDCVPAIEADVIIALGGDGFMLETLHSTQDRSTPVYGMNCGTIGFLMNEFSLDELHQRLDAAEEAAINPLKMSAQRVDGKMIEALAINEVALLRAGPQAAKLRISVDGRVRMEELVCDGALVATPAGSTAYNYSAHGPILPIGADVLALTAMSAFRPRRWGGAILPKSARVRFDVLEPEKRPVMADADSRFSVVVQWVEISIDDSVTHRILFDPGHGLEERLTQEQFA